MSKGSYLLKEQADLENKVEQAVALLEDCTVCAQECRVNRIKGELGVCKGGRNAAVSSYGPHFGEELPLVGARGSGTVFFTFCNLKCKFCQNYDISQVAKGREVSARKLADIMLNLKHRGCHNINLVSPSHFVPQFLEALLLAKEGGLDLPIVYNTGGYDSLNTLELLDGIIDIYMPDIKFGDDEAGRKYSGAAGYFSVVKSAVIKMHQQVGDLTADEYGVATRGLLVRHLVMPGNLARTDQVLEFLAREISPDTFVNIMPQYYPAYKAFDYPEMDRRITREEYREAVTMAENLGLTRAYAR